ncbi:MAG: Cytochrome bd-I ubiquinol oxidase subunit 1 [Phycisphaerae bacterium]|nr:Cytochrome bd-I ubiquinol oxidase subunit 1 [Phycisphaerae bacterium]
MDVQMLSRIQFAITVGFHFLFPPITIGLAWLLVIVEWMGWRRNDLAWQQAGKFFGKLLGLTFAVGVATGIVMEFQFGTNWARYSKFVGDIFGAPLAAEGVFAFFLESTFLGVYLFARNRIARGWHWFAILMVAIGSTLSAFWIIVANSWMQTPAGFRVNEALGRAELTDFWAAVFNPSTNIRYLHTIMAAVVSGAFFMAGLAAWLLLRARKDAAQPEAVAAAARKALKVSLVVGLIGSILVAFPFGHMHAQQVARMQPEKFAAIEGLYNSSDSAPLVLFALPYSKPPQLKASVEVPGLLSWMAFGDTNAEIKGIDQFPADDIPPLWLTFVSFHNMVILGTFFLAATAWGVLRLRGGKVYASRWFLWVLLISIPLPLAACQFGWMTAEAGRQPWIVYHVMRTSDAFSSNLSAAHVLFSIFLLGAIYLALFALYLFLIRHKIRHAAVEMGVAALSNPGRQA